MIIVLDKSPIWLYNLFNRTHYEISFFTLPVTTSGFFYLQWSGIPFHPKRQPFTLKKLSLPFKLFSSWWPNIPVTVTWQNCHGIFTLHLTADIWNYLFHILFIFTASCFFSSNLVTLWTKLMTIHYSCPWQHADTKQLLYKLSAATNASIELFIGATQNLVNLCQALFISWATEISKQGVL